MRKNDSVPISKEFHFSNKLDNIPRCPKCNLICSLNLYYKEGKPIIKYLCENNHKGAIPLEEYMKQYNKHSLSKQKCDDCNKSQNEIKGDFFYCFKCGKFVCHSCVINHPNDDKHNSINYKRYDSFCKIHSNSFDFYCKKCKKNICIYCKSQHKLHEIIDLSECNYSEESKNKLEENIKIIENKIIDLDIIKEEILLEIDKLKKSNELEMKLFKLLIDAYKYEESQNNVNYNVVENLKDFEEIFGLNKIQLYEKVFKEGKRFISFLQNIQKKKEKKDINLFKKNFKTLNNHTKYIYHLSKLKDGRLISCSGDSTLNIYKKDSFELQLSIKEHSDEVFFCTQLINDKIITCSKDNTMNIIKLIDENKYNLEQKLTGHNSYVNNVIEIRENELISVSHDKTMKLWEFKKDKFECSKSTTFQNSGGNSNILKINEDEFVTSSENDKCIKFWNSCDYSLISTINNIETYWNFKILCLIKEYILCVGGTNSKGFYLINISTHQLIKNILGPQQINSIVLCSNGLLLCSIKNENGNYAIANYIYENNDLKKVVEKENIHDGQINICIELDEGIVASGGNNDYLIKLWRN